MDLPKAIGIWMSSSAMKSWMIKVITILAAFIKLLAGAIDDKDWSRFKRVNEQIKIPSLILMDQKKIEFLIISDRQRILSTISIIMMIYLPSIQYIASSNKWTPSNKIRISRADQNKELWSQSWRQMDIFLIMTIVIILVVGLQKHNLQKSTKKEKVTRQRERERERGLDNEMS